MKPSYIQDLIECIVSHPARGAWIETMCIGLVGCLVPVAPREGCVD